MENLRDRKKAVLLLNRKAEKTQNIEVYLDELGLNGKVELFDIYTGKRIGKTSQSISKDI